VGGTMGSFFVGYFSWILLSCLHVRHPWPSNKLPMDFFEVKKHKLVVNYIVSQEKKEATYGAYLVILGVTLKQIVLKSNCYTK